MEIRAAGHHGLVTLGHAYSCGHSKKTVDHRVATGRLIPLYPTVYALGGTPSYWHRDQLAAVYWSGGCASHRAAAFLHQMPGVDHPPPPELTVFEHKVMPHSGVIVHHTKRLPADQVVVVDQIPTTSIERTLLDLGAVWRERHVAVALDSALRRGLTTLGMLDQCLYFTARRGRRGCAVLRRLLHKRVGLINVPETPLETLAFELIAGSSLPRPEPQVPIYDRHGDFVARPDFLYPEFRVAVEGHSVEWHDNPEAQEDDARRHSRLIACGYRVIYVTYRDIVDFPVATLSRIEKALTDQGWVPGERPRLGLS